MPKKIKKFATAEVGCQKIAVIIRELAGDLFNRKLHFSNDFAVFCFLPPSALQDARDVTSCSIIWLPRVDFLLRTELTNDMKTRPYNTIEMLHRISEESCLLKVRIIEVALFKKKTNFHFLCFVKQNHLCKLESFIFEKTFLPTIFGLNVLLDIEPKLFESVVLFLFVSIDRIQ